MEVGYFLETESRQSQSFLLQVTKWNVVKTTLFYTRQGCIYMLHQILVAAKQNENN